MAPSLNRQTTTESIYNQWLSVQYPPWYARTALRVLNMRRLCLQKRSIREVTNLLKTECELPIVLALKKDEEL